MLIYIAFAFGKRVNDPGLSNRMIAKSLFCEFPDALKILQGEIADSFPTADFKKLNVIKIIRDHRTPGKYLDSIELILQSAIFIKSYTMDRLSRDNPLTITVVAHEDHCQRATRDTRELIPFLLKRKVIIRTLPIKADYDEHSTQLWTKNKNIFKVYDILAQIRDIVKIHSIKRDFFIPKNPFSYT